MKDFKEAIDKKLVLGEVNHALLAFLIVIMFQMFMM